jgi:hypothetical protein
MKEDPSSLDLNALVSATSRADRVIAFGAGFSKREAELLCRAGGERALREGLRRPLAATKSRNGGRRGRKFLSRKEIST